MLEVEQSLLVMTVGLEYFTECKMLLPSTPVRGLELQGASG
jgi:hypothetical protein